MEPRPSDDAGRIEDLLLRWEESRDRGRSLGPEELCADDPGLVEELRRLIGVLDQMGGGMDLGHPTGSIPSTATGEESTDFGDGSGPDPRSRGLAECRSIYRDLRFHAEGGLGEVFKATGDDLNREVALKFIKGGLNRDPDKKRRFLMEAEVTGRLEHPGVVPVYGLGLDDSGSPCYAMRFIRGESLHDAIAEFHRQDKPDRDPSERALALRSLLRRFVSVCNTIAYAHSRGVLHRDIKPRNVMVGKFDETLVVDWGLARTFDRPGDAGEETLAPSSGQSHAGAPTVGVVGTPQFMSPEQAEGRPDLGPAADVYSLGATLYALLAGRSPIVASGVMEVLEKVKKRDFDPPRKANPTVPLPLNSICLKAMSLKPEDRYASALDLAADVERWLADEPVSAYREPFLRRAGRWAKRHRTSLSIASTAVFVAIALLGPLAWLQVDRRRRSESTALAMVDQADRLAADARTSDDPARWLRAVAEARRAVDQLESGGGSQAIRLLARTKFEALQAEENRFLDDLRMVEALNKARMRAVAIRNQAFDNRAVCDDYLTAFRAHGIDPAPLTVEEAAGPIRSSRIADQLIAALDDWSWREPTNVSAAKLDAIARAADVDPSHVSIRDAVARRDVVALRGLCATEEARRALGPRVRAVFRALARLDPSNSLPTLEAIRREHPSDFWFNQDLGYAYYHARPPRPEDAVRCLSIAVALRPDSAGALVNLGVALSLAGKADEASAAFREAIRIDPDYAIAHYNYAERLFRAGDAAGSIAEFRQALRLQPDDVEAHSNLGNVLIATGDLDGAILEYREAIRLRPDADLAHYNLGNALNKKGGVDGAVVEYRQAIRVRPDYAEAHCALGLALKGRGEFSEALAELERGHALGSGRPGWRYPSAEWVEDCRRLAALEARLPAILSGEARLDGADERLALVDVCARTGRHAAAARFWTEAFADRPALADDLDGGNRYNAACSAAIAGAGRGKDVPSPDEGARVKLRDQARAWLRADLAAWEKRLDGSEPDRKKVADENLTHWKEDADLAGLRDEAALAKLPEAERQECRALWAEVDRLLARARAGGP